MTRQVHSTALEQVAELIAQEGSDAMGAAFATLLEIGMKLEREQVRLEVDGHLEAENVQVGVLVCAVDDHANRLHGQNFRLG